MSSVRQYVESKAAELGMDRSNVRYIMGNMATAGAPAEATANSFYQSLADKALQTLAKRISKDKEAESKRKTDADNNRPSKRPFGTNDDSLLENKDPFTGENLKKVYLLGDRESLMNEHSKVCYPIPDPSKVEGKDCA